MSWVKSKKTGSQQLAKAESWKLERAGLLSVGTGAIKGFAIHKKTSRMTTVSLTYQWTRKSDLRKPVLVVLTATADVV